MGAGRGDLVNYSTLLGVAEWLLHAETSGD
jgi:hypothetical protein